MLGNGTQGGSGQIEALGGDAIDQLLGRIKAAADGGNGAGNNGGDGGGGGGAGGKDPYDAPATIKMLLDAARQMANFMGQVGRMTAEQQSDFTTKAVGLAAEAIKGERDAMEATARQLHENAMQAAAAGTRLAEAAANRFEALEARIGTLERALGRSKLPENGAGDDAGGGP